MAQFVAINKNAEVNGETVYSIVAGMGAFKDRALDLLLKHGIKNPEPGKWYPQQAWLNAFRTIAEATGSYTLFNIGRKIPENAQFPPDVDSIAKGLSVINVAYHINHRIDGKPLFDMSSGRMSEGIGHYGFEQFGERTVRMVCSNPYPCEFDKGIIDAMAYTFKPASVPVIRITHDDSAPCRSKGADTCTYHITW
jgi:hypothetical protein